jgi:uncharacterized protein YccT (UPF0319 family)
MGNRLTKSFVQDGSFLRLNGANATGSLSTGSSSRNTKSQENQIIFSHGLTRDGQDNDNCKLYSTPVQ